MNIEFHYYTVYYLARQAGLGEHDAFTLAYSSQLVDHNLVGYRIMTPAGEYPTVPTQNYGFWDEAYARDVYIPFHFFPGDNAESNRMDGQKNKFCCTPNSRQVKDLLINALESKNLYRIGTALHTFADSWAHQNFSGRLEPWNLIDESSPVPPIGHAQALKNPDTINGTWIDPRIAGKGRIDNNTRFLEAAAKIFKYFSLFTGQPYDRTEIVIDKLRLLYKKAKSSRERVYDFIIEESIPPYEKDLWLREALLLDKSPLEEVFYDGYSKLLWLRHEVLSKSSLFQIKPVKAKDDFQQSHYFRWNEAIKEHKKRANEILLSRLGISL